jgi:hypothetical protein
LLVATLGGCRGEGVATEPQGKAPRVLGPAVAGIFYPKDKDALTKKVDELLAAAKDESIGNLRALVCPHADYRCSGGVAATGFKQLAGRKFRTVIILGPSHHALFHSAAVADADTLETPLGQIPISPKAAELGGLVPFTLHPKCEDFRRPDWWQNSPARLPAFGEETPFTCEHSVEVECPFLQRMLTDFSVVPAVYGQVEPEEAAEAVLKVLDDQTLLVASSDLTHYISYNLAKSLDKTTTQAIAALSVDWLEAMEEGWLMQTNNQVSLACGIKPILTVMYIARQKGWKAKLLEYRHSSDVMEMGQKPGVGYAAVAFYEPAEVSPATGSAPRPAGQPEFTPAERKQLLELARNAVTAAAAGKEAPEPDLKKLPEKFSQPRACFVTLKENKELRGCVGSIFPSAPLYQAVLSAGRNAAVDDRRFRPVEPAELKNIEVEVSVLTLPERLKTHSPDELLAKLRPGIDGVVLRVDRHQGLFLPQVWKDLPDKQQFLNRLAEEKAGVARAAWRRADARILVFQVEAFEEAK